MPSLLTINNLRAGYGMFSVLHDLSLRVEEGEIVALVGSNGAGKTTCLRAISGLIATQSGDIVFQGKNVTHQKAFQRVAEGLVCVPEGRELFGDLSVKDNLLVGANTPRSKPKRAENLERIYQLFPKLHARQTQLCATLSGGEQQMVAIGRGLMAVPKLLLLDEPSLGLAPTIVKQLFATIAAIRAQGLTVLLVEQNVRTVLTIADRAYVIENGRVELEGAASQLAGDPHVVDAYFGVGSKEHFESAPAAAP